MMLLRRPTLLCRTITLHAQLGISERRGVPLCRRNSNQDARPSYSRCIHATSLPPTPPAVDWSQTAIPEYHGRYAKVIDDLFTPSECSELLALATSPPPSILDPESPLGKIAAHHTTPINPSTGRVEWQQASIHTGLGPKENFVDTDYRNSERILRFDAKAARKIYEKLRSVIPELWEIGPTDRDGGEGKWWRVVSTGRKRAETWKLVGVNERLSFLRYKAGHYFSAHCDGSPQLPDGRTGHVTFQIYLNGPRFGHEHDGGPPELEGGSTRFVSCDGKTPRHYDVETKMGRVLVFQHRRLWHEGMEVLKGEKYALRSDLLFQKISTP